MRSDQSPILLPVGEYMPDMPEYNNPGSNQMLNVVPRTPNSYGPFANLSAFGSAISSTVLGAITAEDSGGNNFVFCGNSTDLFEYSSATATNVSKSSGAYTVSTGERWRFLQFGQRILATDFDNPIQSFTLTSSTKFADLANGAITALTLVPGSNYSNGTYALTITNPGSGTGFTGTATVSGGMFTSYTITNGGTLYPQTATISLPAGAGAGVSGAITSLTLVGGNTYINGTYPLTVTNAGVGSGFAGTITVSSNALSTYSITTAGSNYPATATIAIPTGAGPGQISSLSLVAGSGYTNGTYALGVLNPGNGTGFAGTVTVSGGVLTSYTISNNGVNYSLSATIPIPTGAGSGTSGSITPLFSGVSGSITPVISQGGSITPTISTIAPNARYMAVIDNFLVVANTFDPINGNEPQRVWWSALNDPTNWPTPGTNTAAQFQSSFNDLYGDGGWNMAVVGNLGNADGAVFQERAVFRVIYSGPPATFAFLPAEGVRGTPASNSVVHFGAYVYYLGQDGFYRFDGSTSLPIGANKVDKTFYSMVDQNNMHRIDGCVDPLNKIVYWAFPSVSNINGNPDYIIAYNWVLDRWSLINVTCETIFYSLSFGFTLDNMPGGTLDQIVPSLDSRVWTGGSLTLSGFSSSHQLAYFSGPNLSPICDTSEIEPFPGQITYVMNARPLIDGGAPTVAMASRNTLQAAEAFGLPVAQNSFGTCPQIINGRYVKAEVSVPAGSSWTHYQGVMIEAVPNGTQ